MKINPKLVVIIATLFCSFSAIFVRLSTAPSLVMAAYRMGLTSLILLPAILKNHSNELKVLAKKEFFLCALSGIFLALHFASYFEALRHISVTGAVVLVDTQIIFVAFIVLFFLKERIPPKGVIGIILTLLGSIVIALADNSSAGSNALYGDFLALAGAVFFAFYTCIGYVARRNLSTGTYTFITYFSAFVTLSVLCFISGTPFSGYGFNNLALALLLALFPTLLGHSLYSWSFKFVSAAFVSTATLLEPVFSTVLAVFLFKEIPLPIQCVGVIIIIAGVFIYSSAKDGTKSS